MTVLSVVRCDGCGATSEPQECDDELPIGWRRLWVDGRDAVNGSEFQVIVEVCSAMCGARAIDITYDGNVVPIHGRAAHPSIERTF